MSSPSIHLPSNVVQSSFWLGHSPVGREQWPLRVSNHKVFLFYLALRRLEFSWTMLFITGMPYIWTNYLETPENLPKYHSIFMVFYLINSYNLWISKEKQQLDVLYYSVSTLIHNSIPTILSTTTSFRVYFNNRVALLYVRIYILVHNWEPLWMNYDVVYLPYMTYIKKP